MTKNKILTKTLTQLALGTLGMFLFIIGPLAVVDLSYAKSSLVAMPPMLFMALSWIAAAWWTWDKPQWTRMALTVGAMPARLGICCAWAWMLLEAPGIVPGAFTFSLMLFWITYTIPEIYMIDKMSKQAPY